MLSKVRKFQEGEKLCQVCGDPLPAIICTSGRKWFVCKKEECRKPVHAKKNICRYIGPGEKKCDAPLCTKFIPAGRYSTLRKHFFCSSGCALRFYDSRHQPNTKCALPSCGAPLYRKPLKGSRHSFCSLSHAAAYRSQRISRERAGRFSRFLEEYFSSFASRHYRPRTHRTVRCDLLRFFAFLRAKNIWSLRQVTPRTITEFLSWGEAGVLGKRKKGWAPRSIGTFMSWLIHEGYFKGANPVIPRIHSRAKERRLPRPYSDEQLRALWRILGERGDALSRLAVAIGEEGGLKISETCNLHLPDVDQKRQRLFVRLPNKTMVERWVPYHEKTRRCLEEWLKERDNSCGHDFLFHNKLGKPLTHFALWGHLRTIFDGYHTKKGRSYGEVFVGFKYHRLRHSMATRLGTTGSRPLH